MCKLLCAVYQPMRHCAQPPSTPLFNVGVPPPRHMENKVQVKNHKPAQPGDHRPVDVVKVEDPRLLGAGGAQY